MNTKYQFNVRKGKMNRGEVILMALQKGAGFLVYENPTTNSIGIIHNTQMQYYPVNPKWVVFGE
jgi:hypothetical protein